MRRPLADTTPIGDLTTLDEGMEELRQLAMDYLDCLSDPSLDPIQRKANALLRAGMMGALLPHMHELSYHR